MRYWLDTEFIEDGRTIDLLSIGIVAEDGREFYREAAWADLNRANEWVQANVIPYLHACMISGRPQAVCQADCPVVPRATMQTLIQNFCDPGQYGKPEFWGYFADYDWVALCQLFGTMMDLPKGWPMYCRDIKQWCDMLGNPRLPEQGKGEHHALADARWNKTTWEYLQDCYRQQRAAWAAAGYPGIATAMENA